MKQIVTLLVLLLCGAGHAQWVKTNHLPKGEYVVVTTSGPSLIASEMSAILRTPKMMPTSVSIDNGDSWRTVAVDLEIDVFLSRDNDILAGSFEGVFRSTNEGWSWRSIYNHTPSGIQSLAYDTLYMYAGTSANGVYRSSNNGVNWEQVNTGLTNLMISELINIDSTLIAATQGVIYRSFNRGNSWSQVKGLFLPSVHAFASIAGTVLAGTDSGIYISSDVGLSWTRVTNTPTFATSFAVCGTSIFACPSEGDVILSTDVGVSWNTVSEGLPSDRVIWSLAASESHLYVSAATHEVAIWRRPLSEMITTGSVKTTPVPFALHPNPASESITIDIPAATSLQIVDALGRTIQTYQASSSGSIQIDVSAFSPGCYQAILDSDIGVFSSSFIVAR